MWRAAASLELLPVQTKIELGEAIVRRIRAKEFSDSDLWCLSRLGARQLLYGPANQVIPPSTVSRWVEAIVALPKSTDALVSMARRTGDPVRDLPPVTVEQVRRALSGRPDADRLIAIVEGEEELDSGELDRMFGEELPSGLVIADERTSPA